MPTKTWNGASADWYANSGGNWIPAGDPGATDDVVINSGEAELLSGDAAIKVASVSVTNGILALQDTGKTESVSGNVSLSGGGVVQLDGAYTGGSGGSSLTIGGNLTNSSSSGYGIDIGNTSITSADTVTVNGTGGLSNTGYINIIGSTTVRSTLDIANAAAGFGTKGVETGTVVLENDALLEFKSGEITTVNGWLQLDGANAHVADVGTTGSNSALTGLTSVTDFFLLQNGATVTTTGNLSLTAGTIELDGPYAGGSGGTSLTIGGNLTNSSTNGYGLYIGNTGITSADTVTVEGTGGLSNTGYINIVGSTTVRSTLDIANAAAGFGTKGVETGTVVLENDALLEFKSGEITTINGWLQLDGPNAHVADAGTTGSNSALTGLTSVTDFFLLQNGATLTTTGNLSLTAGTIELDGPYAGGSGGTSLTIGKNLTNSSTNGYGLYIGNTGITSGDTVTVEGTGGLSNTGYINIVGSTTVRSTLDIANAAAGFGTKGVETGTVVLENDALLEFKTGEITTINGWLQLDGANAHVADAGTTGSNSALTGLTSVTDFFLLQNGATLTTTGNLSLTAGTIELDGPYAGGSGGTSLTIGGNLTNSSTNGYGLYIGNTGITSADTVTVEGTGGLSNTGTINIYGSATATAKLVVANTATSSGTIYIGASGDLTATAVDITGGSLQGVGTVAGALHLTGGTVVGGSLSSTPGTLTVSGAYNQSGSGILQADINTGSAQQSSIISVTGSPGTPGAPGSVNLAGGTLLIDAESSLAVGTLYTVMTFGANRLYGEFGTVETEGQLGNNTGTSTSVNLGDGDTLDVLYNEAAGTIQVELVATPSRTTYDWDTGSGTWNASSASDWDPPGNGAIPSSNSSVTIGTGSGGTVTLAQDETINSLSITSGYTLSGATHSVTTNANVSVASGAALSLDDMNVGGVFTDSGGVTLTGVLTINKGGRLTLSNGSITGGGINGSGMFETNAGTTGTLKDLIIYKGTTYTASNAATTDISGAMSDRGTIQVNGGGGTNGFLNLKGATTLSGGGVVALTTTTGGDSAIVEGSGETLTNAGDVIEGTGTIGNGSLAVVNGGTIDANSSAGTKTLILNGTGEITNADGGAAGLLEATGGGTLEIDGITVNNSGGAITANGGVVKLINATIEGGSLNVLGGGTMETVAGDTGTLDGKSHGALTISAGSTYTASNNATTDILGTITDKGTIQVNGGGGTNGFLKLTGATTLNGGGVVNLTTASGGDGAIVEGSALTLTNSGDVLQGTGTIGNGSLALSNGGTIDANVSDGTLTLNGTGGITNTDIFEATSGGHLDVAGAISGAGTLEIGASSEVELGGAASENSTFLSATAATLLIDNATTTAYSGVLTSFVKGDILELGNTDATTATPTKNGVDTTLTVDLSGGGSLKYTLAGNLTGDTFSVTHTGSNSSIEIATDPAFDEAISLLGGHATSLFLESSAIFGASNISAGSAQLNLAVSLHAHS
jgi:hypothetical protein